MIRILFAVFIVLHGLVHMLYFGQSARYFELRPGMVWPNGSWIFSKFLGEAAIRNLACISLILATVGFAAGGAGIFLKQAWSQPVVVGTALFSSGIYILFWDGHMHSLDDKGGIGILINLSILVVLQIFHWPKVEF
jgi:hypothetical protein